MMVDTTVAPSSADEFLRALLASGPISAATVMADAASAGYAWRTVQRAAHRIGAARRKDGMRGGWVWVLDPDPKAPPATWTHRPWTTAAPAVKRGTHKARDDSKQALPLADAPRKSEDATPPRDVLPAAHGEVQVRVGGETSQNLAEPAPPLRTEEASCDPRPAGRALHGAFAAHRWRCLTCLAATRMPERFERCSTGRLLRDASATQGPSATTTGGAG